MTPPKTRHIRYTARKPSWASADQTSIRSLVKFDHLPEETAFTATPYDGEPLGREIFQRAAAGEFGEVAAFDPPSPAPVPTAAIEALGAYAKSAQEEELADEIARRDGENADSGRGIAAYVETVLSDRLASLIGPERAAQATDFSSKVKAARGANLISAREAVALDLIGAIRNEIIDGEAGTFKSDYVRIYVNCLHACLVEIMTYNPTKSVEDDWIDLIFLDAYTLLSGSLVARAEGKPSVRVIE